MGWLDSAVDWVSDNSGTVLQGAGTVLGFMSDSDAEDAAEDAADRQADEYQRVALANSEISLYDAAVAKRIGVKQRFEKNAKAGLMYKDLNKFMASQRTRYAKSGVAISKGTPVDVMEQTLIEGARDIMNVKYEGQSAKAKADSLAKRYKLLADKGLRDSAAQASLIEEAANDTVDAMKWNKYGKLATNVYDVGKNFEWF
jgi:hypothetical protein